MGTLVEIGVICNRGNGSLIFDSLVSSAVRSQA